VAPTRATTQSRGREEGASDQNGSEQDQQGSLLYCTDYSTEYGLVLGFGRPWSGMHLSAMLVGCWAMFTRKAQAHTQPNPQL
jgi:hypothetical protein